VPRTGHIISYEGTYESLTQLGPIARRVDDLAYVLPIIAGPDGVDPHVVPMPLRDHRRVEIRGLRVAHFTALPPFVPTPETVSAVERAVGIMERAGCRVRPVELPDPEQVYATYTAVLFGDGGASVARLLDRWGSAESPLRERIRGMTTLTSGELTERYERWDRWRSRMLRLFADHDVLLCPVLATRPLPIGELHGCGEEPFADFVRSATFAPYTAIWNVTGQPAMSVPAGLGRDGQIRGGGDVGCETRSPLVVAASDGAVEDADVAHAV
jgi:amidase